MSAHQQCEPQFRIVNGGLQVHDARRDGAAVHSTGTSLPVFTS